VVCSACVWMYQVSTTPRPGLAQRGQPGVTVGVCWYRGSWQVVWRARAGVRPLFGSTWGSMWAWFGASRGRARYGLMQRLSFFFVPLALRHLGLGGGLRGWGHPAPGFVSGVWALIPCKRRGLGPGRIKRSLRRRARKKVAKGGVGRLWLRL
jgi:hypothetical protein